MVARVEPEEMLSFVGLFCSRAISSCNLARKLTIPSERSQDSVFLQQISFAVKFI